MNKLEVEDYDTYNIYQIVQMEDLKSRVIDDLKVTIEMINEIDSRLNTKKQSDMLYRIMQINISILNRKVYDETKNIRDFIMSINSSLDSDDGYYERTLDIFLYYNQ